ncbi:Glutamyl-tRNA amidotransferase B subunit [Multifurca ochricompacta]|uniref:Glutamyl-tRNA(Gln) amidotransferase subunit B, mitochondrial n=1 Tax=Multifurca ochricompacta TaxID=376703 RepID=A0AAD4QST0_9AGAM|nr:Glutamyl-tRNA amidotransferase B subunit [Multifurca ochricompacta]
MGQRSTVNDEHSSESDGGAAALAKIVMFVRSRTSPSSLRTPRRLYSTGQANTIRTFEKDSRWPGWQVIIGIEVHAQIKSREKLFSQTWAPDLGSTPNSHVSPYDAAFPGTLPVTSRLNFACVNLALRTAIALQSDIQQRSTFDRKHYFYSDLPAGYQITQHYNPIARGGYVFLPKSNISVCIEQIQLEQDTGKSLFEPRRRLLSIDLNRAGIGLMEIVSKPDMRSPEEAGEYVRTLQALLRSVGAGDGNMEQGSLRCDVNVSVNRYGQSPGTRCEIKNLNSVRFMMVAIGSEVHRQIAMLDTGKSVPQETRGFNEDTGETFALRSKEEAPDYRYMPDPNLPPLFLTEGHITSVRKEMPALAVEIRERLAHRGLTHQDIDVLMAVDSGNEIGFDGRRSQGAVAYFEALAKGRNSRTAVNWMIHELLGQLTQRKKAFHENPISQERMGSLIDMVQSGIVTGSSGKLLLRHMLDHPSSEPLTELGERLGLLAVRGDDFVEHLCLQAIADMPEEANAVRRGVPNVINKLLGQVIRASKGRADPQSIRRMLQKQLSSP